MEDQKFRSDHGLDHVRRQRKKRCNGSDCGCEKGDFELADAKIKDAEESLVQAHHSQTGLLTQEAQREHMEVTLLTVHSQDHLMTSIAFTDLAKEIIDLYRRIEA